MRGPRQRHGLRTRLYYFLVELRDVLLDLAPQRRRARYGDIGFDCDHRTNTTAANVNLATRLRGVFAGSQYQPADPVLFAESMAALPIDFSSYIFIDAGSGKGRALLMACQYPFRRVIGIELVPELHAIAQRNLRQRPRELCRCESAESQLGNALLFPWPLESTVLFLFNPFPEWVLEQFIARLGESLQQHPRNLWAIYHNPVLEHALAESGFLRRVSSSPEAAIYTNADLYTCSRHATWNCVASPCAKLVASGTRANRFHIPANIEGDLMAQQLYTVTWECMSCGREHSFRHTVSDDIWPNKFELECENPDCGHAQDVPFRTCTVEPFTLASSGE